MKVWNEFVFISAILINIIIIKIAIFIAIANVTSICVTVLCTTIFVVNSKTSRSIIILLAHIASDIPLTCVRRSAERKVTTLGKLVYIREMLLVAAFDKLVYYHLLYNISLSSSYLAIFVKRPKMPIVENRTPSHQNSNAFHAYIALSQFGPPKSKTWPIILIVLKGTVVFFFI